MTIQWIIFSTLRRALTPVRIAAAMLLLSLVPVVHLADGTFDMPEPVLLAFTTVVLGAGLLGTDRRSGMEALILARPVRRWQLVVGRWAGATIITLLLACVVLVATVAFARWALGASWPWPSQVASWVVTVAVGAGSAAAALTLVSSWLPRGADAGTLILSLFTLKPLQELLEHLGAPAPLVEGVQALILAMLPMVKSITPTRDLVALASNGALMLLLAVIVMNRREIAVRSEA